MFTNMVHNILYEYIYDFYGPNLLFKHVCSVANCFPPSHNIALSVVSMELWSPHKMAEIRHRTQQRGGPDPRIVHYLKIENLE